MTEPSILCVTCVVLRPKGKPREPNTPNVCDGCRERLDQDLQALPDAYALVDVEPVRGMSEIRSRAFESRPPLSITALSLLGPGWDTPPAILIAWAGDWANRLDHTAPGETLSETARWLWVRLSWACGNHPNVDEFASDLRRIAGELHAHTGRDRGERVGNCPRQYGDDHCNTPLYVDPYVDEIECSRCHQKWKRKAGEWMHLRAQQLSAGVEAA